MFHASHEKGKQFSSIPQQALNFDRIFGVLLNIDSKKWVKDKITRDYLLTEKDGHSVRCCKCSSIVKQCSLIVDKVYVHFLIKEVYSP